MNQNRYQPPKIVWWAAVALALLVIVGVAIGSAQHKSPAPKPVPIAGKPSTTPDAKTAATRASFYTTWNGSNEYKRDGLCSELKRFGKAKTAEAMKSGAKGSNALDWNLAADLLLAECSKR